MIHFYCRAAEDNDPDAPNDHVQDLFAIALTDMGGRVRFPASLFERQALARYGDYVRYRLALTFDHEQGEVEIQLDPLEANGSSSGLRGHTLVWNYTAAPDHEVTEDGKTWDRNGIRFDEDAGKSRFSLEQLMETHVTLGFLFKGVVGNIQWSDIQIFYQE